MLGSYIETLFLSLLVCSIQVLAAIPWLLAVDPGMVKSRLSSVRSAALTFGIFAGVCVVLAYFLRGASNSEFLGLFGKLWMFVLQVQLTADLFVAVFFIMLKVWPKGGAVALSAFREGVRQPLFWILTIAGIVLLFFSIFIPYFTFGEDDKMLKDLGFMTIMFTGALFGVLAASMSIYEEIEGRAAITVMSKPISRRNFLFGKFIGIALAALVMNVCLSWVMVWVVEIYKVWSPVLQAEPPGDPLWVSDFLVNIYGNPGTYSYFTRGILLWMDSFVVALPGFVITFCQVMVLTAIAVALATRMPMIVNTLLCLTIYLLGHLTPVLMAVPQLRLPLVAFVAQVFNYVLPGLDMFDMGPAVVRYAPLPAMEFGVYTFHVALYAVIYTVIALLFGLILFEDRDLA